jgi:hypothetical protein
MVHKESSHRKALEKIASNPKVFGIEEVIYSSVEPDLFDKNRLIAKPDIVFYCLKGEVYIIEYKGSGNGELLKRAEQQLSRAACWFAKYFPVDLDKIYTKIITGEDLVQKLNFYTR